MAYITIEEIKKLQIKSLEELDDEALQVRIDRLSGLVEEYCNTKFEPTDHKQKFDVASKLRVAKTPLIEVGKFVYAGTEQVEDLDYYVYTDLNVIEIEDTCQFERKKNSIQVEYKYGYEKVPATVKEVIIELLKLEVEQKDQSNTVKSETFDKEYSYTKQSGTDNVKTKEGILALLDRYVEEEYVPISNKRVRARVI